ncbi:MAG: hypothetical protein ACREQ2_21445, partial [Candidatus Binatia bacterium]
MKALVAIATADSVGHHKVYRNNSNPFSYQLLGLRADKVEAAKPMSSLPSGRKLRQEGRMMMEDQRHGFQELLEYAWNRSPFYRDYYASHGIDAKNFPEISVSDLPLLPKKLLIENFDQAVTDPRLKRSELERWFEE